MSMYVWASRSVKTSVLCRSRLTYFWLRLTRVEGILIGKRMIKCFGLKLEKFTLSFRRMYVLTRIVYLEIIFRILDRPGLAKNTSKNQSRFLRGWFGDFTSHIFIKKIVFLPNLFLIFDHPGPKFHEISLKNLTQIF